MARFAGRSLRAHGGIRQISWRLYRRIIDRTLLDRSAAAVAQLTVVRSQGSAKNGGIVTDAGENGISSRRSQRRREDVY